MSDELAKMAINRVEYIRTITSDPELAHAEEKELWEEVLDWASKGGDVKQAAKEALKTKEIDFPRWFA